MQGQEGCFDEQGHVGHAHAPLLRDLLQLGFQVHQPVYFYLQRGSLQISMAGGAYAGLAPSFHPHNHCQTKQYLLLSVINFPPMARADR